MEIEIFAEMNSEFVISTDMYIEKKWENPLFRKLEWKKGEKQTEVLINSYKGAAESMTNILGSMKTYQKNDIFKNKESIRLAMGAVEKIIIEFLDASTMWEELRTKWKVDSSNLA